MPGAASFVQVAPDSTGKKIRNVENTIGVDVVEQQVVSRAKSDGTLLDDEATETTLALIKASTDKIDVLLSTRTKPADSQHVTIDNAALEITNDAGNPVPVSGTVTVGFPADQLVHATNLDIAASLLAKDATLGIVGPQPGAYTVLDLLGKTASEVTMRKVLAAIQAQTAKAPAKATSTLLHRS